MIWIIHEYSSNPPPRNSDHPKIITQLLYRGPYYASLAADHPNFCIETTLTSPDSTDVTTIQIIQAVSTYFEGDFYCQS